MRRALIIGISFALLHVSVVSALAQGTATKLCGGNLPATLTLNSAAAQLLAFLDVDRVRTLTSKEGVEVGFLNNGGSLEVRSIPGYGSVYTATRIPVRDLVLFQGLKMTVDQAGNLQVPYQVQVSPIAPATPAVPVVAGVRGFLIRMLQQWRTSLMADVRQQLQATQKSGC